MLSEADSDYPFGILKLFLDIILELHLLIDIENIIFIMEVYDPRSSYRFHLSVHESRHTPNGDKNLPIANQLTIVLSSHNEYTL